MILFNIITTNIVSLVNTVDSWFSMVRCAVIGCNNQSPEDKCSFYKLPTIIHNQGQQMLEISTERRRAWLWVISRGDLREDNLGNVVVCEFQFDGGKHVLATLCNDCRPN